MQFLPVAIKIMAIIVPELDEVRTFLRQMPEESLSNIAIMQEIVINAPV